MELGPTHKIRNTRAAKARRNQGRLFGFTLEEAKQFNTYSARNVSIIETECHKRGCSCHAYVDVFTPQRWMAQGLQVRQGEKAIKIPTYRLGRGPKQKTDYIDPRLDEYLESQGKQAQSALRFSGFSSVFCRCQVTRSLIEQVDVKPHAPKRVSTQPESEAA
jgi:hypothetical protein